MSKVTFTKDIESCIDCPNHEVVHDPDPYDSFNMDDCAVICKITPSITKDSQYWWQRKWVGRHVTWACRPYNARKESSVPSWCPLRKKEDD